MGVAHGVTSWYVSLSKCKGYNKLANKLAGLVMLTTDCSHEINRSTAFMEALALGRHRELYMC